MGKVLKVGWTVEWTVGWTVMDAEWTVGWTMGCRPGGRWVNVGWTVGGRWVDGTKKNGNGSWTGWSRKSDCKWSKTKDLGKDL